MKLTLIISAFLLIGFCSCEKEEVKSHRDGVVLSNDPPVFNGVSDVLINNYINRYFIDLLGEQPSDTAMVNASFQLQQNPKSESVRKELIAAAVTNDIYFDRFFSTTSLIFLAGIEKAELEERQMILYAVRENEEANGDSLLVQFIDYQILKLDSLIKAPARMKLNQIGLKEFFRAFCYNGVYDEINMGSLNFVQSCFENLFGRKPTNDELERAIAMVEGNNTYLFLRVGKTKLDFINIMLDNPEFLVGRTHDIYQQLLQRKPNTSEEVQGVQMLEGKQNVKDLQIQVVKKAEYAGF